MVLMTCPIFRTMNCLPLGKSKTQGATDRDVGYVAPLLLVGLCQVESDQSRNRGSFTSNARMVDIWRLSQLLAREPSTCKRGKFVGGLNWSQFAFHSLIHD